MLYDAAGCCCWLLLLIVAVGCCCRLPPLMAVAGRRSSWFLDDCRSLLDYCLVDDCWLWLEFCLESLWILPGYWWFAAKTIFQAEKSWNISGVPVICGWDNSAGEKVFEYFRVVDDVRLRQFCRRKSFWIFSGYWWEEGGRELRLGKVG